MHFWIDKRSQACGFGRARVAASLSGGGLGFGHPRRVRGKSMVTPIHRFQTVDCSRPHIYRQHQHQQHQQQQQQLLQQQQNNQHQLQIHHQQQQQHQQHQQPSSHNSSHHQSHHQSTIQQQSSNNYHIPVSVNHIYNNAQQNAIEIDQSTLGIGSLGHGQHISHDAQLLPAHLKCGMWASLALATVFVAGAKFYFDHQGTGLEVLIFCAFTATFFLAACTVSLCRRPRELNINNNIISEPVSNGEPTPLQNNHDLITTNLSQMVPGANLQQSSMAIVAPPPPYHIAILLPENPKEPDETPPPSYDKIVI